MEKCMLIKPDFSFESDIQAFRKEMLDANHTILANGGVYENTIYCGRDDVNLERYWIHI